MHIIETRLDDSGTFYNLYENAIAHRWLSRCVDALAARESSEAHKCATLDWSRLKRHIAKSLSSLTFTLSVRTSQWLRSREVTRFSRLVSRKGAQPEEWLFAQLFPVLLLNIHGDTSAQSRRFSTSSRKSFSRTLAAGTRNRTLHTVCKSRKLLFRWAEFENACRWCRCTREGKTLKRVTG